MAEITQKLGFDAQEALETFSKLDTSLKTYNDALNGSVEAMKTFNRQAGKTVTALKHLASNGKEAVEQLTKLGKIQAGPAAAPKAGGGPKTQDIDAYVAKFQEMYKLTSKATEGQKRSYASMITSAADFAAKNKVSMDQIGKQANNLDKVYQGKANTMANHLNKMSTAAQNTASKWTVSWETMARVVATQAIVRALNIIRQSLKAAIGDAVKFQRAIAEIGTIADREVGSLENIAGIVNRVSDAFNVGLDDASEAAYQTLSNQIAQTSAELESFLGSAAKFSKITKTDMATSVNLLTGTLNAFGKTVDETEDVAAKFFNTIKLGRTRAEELAQGYGTVAPIADKLGISMEELNASVATLTINGIKTDKAFTQIRGTMQAFLKPTTAMKDALRALGFASGEQLLQANNLQEALKLVAGQTDQSAAAIAKLFPRIRGLTGVLTLLSDENDHFSTSLKEQQTALEDAYGKAYELVIETHAEKITKELNELKNFFTVEFGQSILEAGVKLSQVIGGADTLKNVFKAMAPVLPLVATSLVLVAGALALVGVKAAFARANLTGMHKAAVALFAVYAAFAAGKYIGAQISDSWEAEFKAQDAVNKRLVEARNLKIAAEIAAEKSKIQTLIKLIGKSLAASRKEFFKVADAAVDSNKEILADAKISTNSIIAQRQKMVNALQRQVDTMGDNIVSSEKRATNLRDSLDDQLFKRKIKRDSDRQRFNKLTQKSAELAASATAKLSRAATEDERGSAQEEFNRAKAFADQALSIADSTDSRTLEKKALQHLEGLTEDLIDAEKRYQKNIEASAQALVKRTAKETKNLKKMKEKQKELLDALTLYDTETGEILPADERATQLQKAQKAMREFIDLSGDPLDVSEMLNFTGVAVQLAETMHSFQIRELTISGAALADVSNQVDAAINRRRVEDPAFGLAEGISGVDMSTAAGEAKALEVLEGKYEDTFAKRQKYLQQGTKLVGAQRGLANALKGTGAEAHKTAAFFAGAADAWRGLAARARFDPDVTPTSVAYLKQIEAVFDLARKAKAGGGAGIHPDEVTRMSTAMQAAAQTLPVAQEASWSNYTTQAKNALLKTKEVVAEYQAMKKLEGDVGVTDASLQQLQAAIDYLKGPKESAEIMSTSLVTAKTAQEGMVTPAQQVATANTQSAVAVERMATASKTYSSNITSAMTLLGSTDFTGFASGGRVGYFANGGRGTDTIPAMLSQGEFVTNAKSSRRFFSQLQAMNAGQTPVYRNEGGDTYNTNISDVNVSSPGKPSVVAREVMKAIRREERRGSGR